MINFTGCHLHSRIKKCIFMSCI